MPRKQIEFIKENTHMGFDELAYNLYGSDKPENKERVKKIWNEQKLGWHMTPRTLVSNKRLDHKRYELLEDIVVFLAPAMPFVVPKGFIHDYASVPRIFHWFIDKDDKGFALAAIVHDALCRAKWMPRFVADAIFLQIMIYRRAMKWKRIPAYLAVRGFSLSGLARVSDIMIRDTRELLFDAIERYKIESNLDKNLKAFITT